jgi:hypothetical protein
MRLLDVLPLLLLGACASSAGRAAAPQTVHVIGGSGSSMQLTITPTDGPSTSRLEFPMDRVWGALPVVYQTLEIPIEQVDQTTHVIGNPSLKLRRRLGNVLLSRYLNCGSTQGGPNTDTYEVHLSVLTQAATRGDDGATVTTLVEAAARPVSLSGEYIRCTSKGVLEARISELLRTQLSR